MLSLNETLQKHMQLTHNNEDFESTVKAVMDAKVILYPTDTIWGLGGNPFDERVFDRVNEIKNRPNNKPFVLLIPNLESLQYFVDKLHPRIETLISFYTRPMTVIYPHARNLPKYCLGEDGSVALRITSDPFCKALMERTKTPLISTSANVNGQPPPERFGGISSEILTSVDYIVKHRQNDLTKSTPSQIFNFDDEGNLRKIRS